MRTLEAALAEQMQDAEFKKEYEALEDEFQAKIDADEEKSFQSDVKA